VFFGAWKGKTTVYNAVCAFIRQPSPYNGEHSLEYSAARAYGGDAWAVAPAPHIPRLEACEQQKKYRAAISISRQA